MRFAASSRAAVITLALAGRHLARHAFGQDAALAGLGLDADHRDPGGAVLVIDGGLADREHAGRAAFVVQVGPRLDVDGVGRLGDFGAPGLLGQMDIKVGLLGLGWPWAPTYGDHGTARYICAAR